MATHIDVSEEAGVRYLHFGSDWVQGAMRIRDPNALELQYTREMMAGLLLRDEDWPRSVLTIGLGAGSVTKFIHHHCPQARQTVVEIEPRVIAAARHFFALPDPDQRLTVETGDGADYVQRGERRFDHVLVDGYDAKARSGALDTPAFYAAVRARLSDQGLMAVNLFGSARGFDATLARICKAFDGRVLAFPSCDSGNVIVFAATGEEIALPLADMRERARTLKTRTGLDLLPAISRLEQAGSVPGGVLLL
ncbi:MAG: fused MFS/spermidine synthase [Zoogloeaceae bacterium]|nr:fused MFS/spermidine synthase [Zoogloeaceae bacterium]